MSDVMPLRQPRGSSQDGRVQPPSDRRLKVCIASLAPFVGGAEVAAERLAVGLRDAGHDVLMILGRPGAVRDRMERAGLRCVVTPMHLTDKWRWWRCLRSRGALRRLILREQPDVLHSNDLPTHQVTSAAALGLGIPRICHHRYPFDGPTADWLNKYGAERHLFVSRALMDEICEGSTTLGASGRSVVHDGLALPPRPTAEDRRIARRRLGLDPGGVVVTIAGQVIERKGIADLLCAWMMLGADMRASADLLIVGDDIQNGGTYRVVMEGLAGDLRCPARFVGFQSNVSDWLLASDIAAVPSHVEPLGNATLEAMSYALPVVGCAVGGIPEMVVHERTGLLVPPKDPGRLSGALTRLIADERTRQAFGTEGRRRCEERFSLKAHVHNVLDKYISVIPQQGAMAAV